MINTLLPTRRAAEDVRVDAFVRAIRRTADCTADCDHEPVPTATVELPAIVATASAPLTRPATSVVERMGTRALSVLVLAGILVSVLLTLTLMPAAAAPPAQTTAELGRGLQVLLHLDQVVAAAGHSLAATPR